MTLSLSAALILEKNLLATDGAWLTLVDFTLPNGSHIRLVRNTEDITFGGNIYTAFPLAVSPMQQLSDSSVPTLNLRISNVTRTLQAYMETYNGGKGCTCSIITVSSKLLAENYSALTLQYDVLSSTSDANWLSFTLGAANPLRHRFPPYRAIASSCNFPYRGVECAYAGPKPSCKRTLDDCRVHGNSARFGGFPGLGGGGLRLVG